MEEHLDLFKIESQNKYKRQEDYIIKFNQKQKIKNKWKLKKLQKIIHALQILLM